LALAKNKGTEVFRLVPLRGEVSESVPLFQKLQQKKETKQIVFLIKPSFFFFWNVSLKSVKSHISPWQKKVKNG